MSPGILQGSCPSVSRIPMNSGINSSIPEGPGPLGNSKLSKLSGLEFSSYRADYNREATATADAHTLLDELGPHARHAVGLLGVSVNLAYPFGHGDAALGGRALPSGIEAAGRHTQDAAHGAHGKVGLVRHHESEYFVEFASLRPANQAVAFARMSRSS
jgi:hypothetical protein